MATDVQSFPGMKDEIKLSAERHKIYRKNCWRVYVLAAIYFLRHFLRCRRSFKKFSCIDRETRRTGETNSASLKHIGRNCNNILQRRKTQAWCVFRRGLVGIYKNNTMNYQNFENLAYCLCILKTREKVVDYSFIGRVRIRCTFFDQQRFAMGSTTC